MADRNGYLVSNERAGFAASKAEKPTSSLRGFFMVTGAMNQSSRAFELFTSKCGDAEYDTFHPIDPFGSVDVQRVYNYVSGHLTGRAGVLVGICGESLVPGSRIQVVERHTIDVAKKLGRKVAVLFQDADHLTSSPMNDNGNANNVDIVILCDVMFSANTPKWVTTAHALFPVATVIVADSIAFGGASTREAMDQALIEH